MPCESPFSAPSPMSGSFSTPPTPEFGHELGLLRALSGLRHRSAGRRISRRLRLRERPARSSRARAPRRGRHASRCAPLGLAFNNVDLVAAAELGITITRVPAYSPMRSAEHTVGLILALNRGIHRAFARVRDRNFALGGLLWLRPAWPNGRHRRYRRYRLGPGPHPHRLRMQLARLRQARESPTAFWPA